MTVRIHHRDCEWGNSRFLRTFLQKKGNKLKICLPLSMFEIQLLRAFSTYAATAGFRNLGDHPAYSNRFGR